LKDDEQEVTNAVGSDNPEDSVDDISLDLLDTHPKEKEANAQF
jgi:hypothetical protein